VDNPRRDAFIGVLTELAAAVMRRLPLDSAADQLGKRLMQQRLPPPPSHLSAAASKSGAAAAAKLKQSSVVRLMQEGGARVMVEDDRAVVYHSFANPRLEHMEGGEDDVDEVGEEEEKAGKETSEVKGEEKDAKGKGKEEEEVVEEKDEPGKLSFDLDCGPALEALLHAEDAAEEGVMVKDLPLPKQERLEMVRRLVEARVLAVVK